MSSKYLQLTSSAETKENADEILNVLLNKKLVTGGQIINAPARFLWKGKIADMNYFSITSFTLEKHKEAIIQEIKQVSTEEVPMIVFKQFDGNSELLKWIEETLK